MQTPTPSHHHEAHQHEPNQHGMGMFTRLFIYGVIVADVFAITYFGGTWLLTGTILPHAHEEKIVVAGAEEATQAAEGPKEAAPAFDLASYVADPVKGAQVAAKCKACHTFEQGAPNRTGPNMWGIYDGPFMHKNDFSYSAAFAAKKAEITKWDETHLHAFLENPKSYIPGTKMSFNGIKNPAERADLIAWMKTLR